MNTMAAKANAESIIPAVHLEFIQNHLENPKASGPEEVEQYHRALFLHHHAVEWEKYRQVAKTHEDKLSFLEGQLKTTDLSLSARTKLVPVNVDGEEDTKPTSPWNTWDLIMFAACSAGIICLITFGVWNISFNLLESGLITFRENPLRSYLWAALLPVGALAVKIGWDFLQDRKRRDIYLWSCLSLGMAGACILIAAQVFVGDHVGSTLVKYQPAKLQAAEGWWDKTTPSPTPYLWVIVPDQAEQRNRFQWGTPYFGSVWLTKSLKGTIGGLRNTPVDQQPRMVLVFYSFKLMLALGMVMFTLAVISLWLRWHGRLYSARWFLRALVVMTPSGVVATLGGWYTAEIGRQPFVINGMMRTAEALSPVPAVTLLSTLIAFVCVYAVFFLAFLVFTLRIIRRGPSGLPAHALPSGSLKRGLRPEIAGVQPYLSGGE